MIDDAQLRDVVRVVVAEALRHVGAGPGLTLRMGTADSQTVSETDGGDDIYWLVHLDGDPLDRPAYVRSLLPHPDPGDRVAVLWVPPSSALILGSLHTWLPDPT